MSDKPLVVLALDIAKHRTGWAIGSPGMNRPYWGTFQLEGQWERREGECLERWEDFLISLMDEHAVTYLAMERLIIDMRDFTYDGTVPMAQMHGAAMLLARRRKIRSGGVAIASWRAHFLGTKEAPKGLAKGSQRTNWFKDEAIRKCIQRNWYASLHDEAEALGIMDFALACLDADYEHSVGPYTRRAELKADVAKFRGETPKA